jgi:hypothetical protein
LRTAGGGRGQRRNAMRRLRANLVARGQRLRCYLKTSSTLCEEGLKACKDKYTTGGGVAPVGEERGC